MSGEGAEAWASPETWRAYLHLSGDAGYARQITRLVADAADLDVAADELRELYQELATPPMAEDGDRMARWWIDQFYAMIREVGPGARVDWREVAAAFAEPGPQASPPTRDERHAPVAGTDQFVPMPGSEGPYLLPWQAEADTPSDHVRPGEAAATLRKAAHRPPERRA